MEKYKEEIIKLENEINKEVIIQKVGNYPVMLTSVHSMNQIKNGKIVKLREPFTKAIVKYISNKVDVSYLIKTKDDGIDPNYIEKEKFKSKLIKLVKDNNIKLVFDIHGASEKRKFDVEFGTLNNLSADFSTINELKEEFEENGIENIAINNPFKGGMITQYLYMCSDVEVIQIEINKKYRNINDLEKTKRICDAIIKFINKYVDNTNIK